MSRRLISLNCIPKITLLKKRSFNQLITVVLNTSLNFISCMLSLSSKNNNNKDVLVTTCINHQCFLFRSNVTPNAQESEDSGLSLSYSVLGHDVANRISSSNNVVNGTGVHDDHRSDGDYGMDTDNNAYRENANDTNDFR